jgi:serine/threonine protein kinase
MVLPRPGDLLAGKYRIDRAVASGGMAAIFAAEHVVLGQRVAVKVLFAESARNPETVERLLREARASARLQTAHVARVLDAGVLDNTAPFLVMEYLDGRDLGAVAAQRGPMPPEEVADFVLQALEGLAHAHAAGIIHRDLKPSNLFLTEMPDGSQILKVLDFGVSKSLTPDPGGSMAKALTGSQVIGSPMYMSPEQVRNARGVDARSDIFSLGITMYELLTGVMPFEGDGVGETLAAILDAAPVAPRTHAPSLPKSLEKVVLRCLKKAREDRYSTVAELARALAPFGSGRWSELPARIQATLNNAHRASSPDSLAGVSTESEPHIQVDPLAPTIPPPSLAPSGSLALVRTNVNLSRPSVTPRRAARSFVGGALAGAAIGILTGLVGWYGTALRAPGGVASAAARAGAELAAPAPVPAPAAAPAPAPEALAELPALTQPAPPSTPAESPANRASPAPSQTARAAAPSPSKAAPKAPRTPPAKLRARTR